MIVTYSRNVFLPLTRNCRNKCWYCGFKSEKISIMQKEEVEKIFLMAKNAKEALFTFGEKPDVYPEIRKILRLWGYKNFLDYVVEMNKLAISHGLLPHTNAGVLSKEELEKLKNFNASLGLMLEQAVELECHSESPGKKPEKRIRTIKNAGKLQIPFTTGLLLGIGEKEYDRAYSLEVIAEIQKNFGHIQEVIIQNFKPKKGTRMENWKEPSFEEILRTVELARKILPKDVAIQIPPNLIENIYPFLKLGANDLGGISEITPDYINPELPWPSLSDLRKRIGGFTLRERLPVYPKFVKLKLFGSAVSGLIEVYSDEDGYARFGSF
ncbi:MAG: 7,8-didemethyl-8-hydroxy-5-deazariboflavin synthase subunit CofG [Archaeoglobaceae archaeon]|nr:7,8-didemethyl-8-hydroxy-5-deazariboflavin synthase subunit CofG [Archaeoglobaceae archaeon]MDW7989358.1 7,8-didemethyl-8-hydroxy-5-deazariboflavin synthase subunit CofG [Archaeoglobaceae archaeon]